MILSVLGWNIDLADCDLWNITDCPIQKTGAIFIETTPRSVEFTLDGLAYKDTSSIIESGTLLKNLTVGNHLLRIQKNGYRPWEKMLAVSPGRVTEALGVILVPEVIKEQPMPFPAVRGNTIEDINPRGDMVIVKDTRTKTFYLYDRDTSSVTLNLSLAAGKLFNTRIERAAFHPLDDTRIVVETANQLALVNSRNMTSLRIAPRPSAWIIEDETVFYTATSSPTLRTFNLITRTWAERGILATTTAPVADIEIANNIQLLRTTAQNLLAVTQDRAPLSIDDRVTSMTLSPDGRKIAYVRNGEARVYFLRDWSRGADKKAGDRTRIASPHTVHAVIWYQDSTHLFIVYKEGGTLRGELVELDDRAPRNRYEIIEGAASIRYHRGSGLLFLIREGRLFFFPL